MLYFYVVFEAIRCATETKNSKRHRIADHTSFWVLRRTLVAGAHFPFAFLFSADGRGGCSQNSLIRWRHPPLNYFVLYNRNL